MIGTPSTSSHATAMLITLLAACGTARAGDTKIALVPIGDAGRGRLQTVFRMGAFEITNAQYCEFLNAVARADPNGLYHQSMGSSTAGGIERSGQPGAYAYRVKPNFADKPVFFVRWNNAARFINWLENGRPAGDQSPATTEDGTYTLLGDETADYFSDIPRNTGSRWFLPSIAEWRKAAYWDPMKDGVGGWWTYATRSDDLPAPSPATPAGMLARRSFNVANYDSQANWNGSTGGNVTTVGGSGRPSAFGTFDQNGNVFEWLQTRVCASAQICGKQRAGGGYFSQASALLQMFTQGADYPDAFPYHDSADGQDFAMSGIRVAAVCSADFDRDGVVDYRDFAAFVTLFTVDNPEADLNDDGVVDFGDYLAFIAAYDAGC